MVIALRSVLAGERVFLPLDQFDAGDIALLTAAAEELGASAVEAPHDATVVLTNARAAAYAPPPAGAADGARQYAPYHWLALCGQAGARLDPATGASAGSAAADDIDTAAGLEPPAPFFVRPVASPLGAAGQPLRAWVSVNVARQPREHAHAAQAAVQAALRAGGALIVAKRAHADVLIIDPRTEFYRTVKAEKERNGRDWQRLAERKWVEACENARVLLWTTGSDFAASMGDTGLLPWDGMCEGADGGEASPRGGGTDATGSDAAKVADAAGAADTADAAEAADAASAAPDAEEPRTREDSFAEEDRPPRRGPGRPVGKPRVEYSPHDDDFLCRYLAAFHPGGSWGSRKTYQTLRAGEFPTAARHSAQSWHERYKKNQNPFTRRIERFVRADIDKALLTDGEREKEAQREAERRARAGGDSEANGENGGDANTTDTDAEERARRVTDVDADANPAAPTPAPAQPVPPQAPSSSPLATGRKRKLAVSDIDSDDDDDDDDAPAVKRRAQDKSKRRAEPLPARAAIGRSARARQQDPPPHVAAINFPGRAAGSTGSTRAAGETAGDGAANNGAAATEPAAESGAPATDSTEDPPAAVLPPAELLAPPHEASATVEVQVQVEMISVEVSGPEEVLGSVLEIVREDLGLGDNAPPALGADEAVVAAADLINSVETNAAAAFGAATDAAAAADVPEKDTADPAATPRARDLTPAPAASAALASQLVSPPRTPPLTLKHLPGSPVISVRAPALPTPARGRVSLPAVDADGQPYDRGHNTAPSRVADEIAAQRRRRSSLSTPNARGPARVSTGASTSASARRRRPIGVDTVTSSTAAPPPYRVPPRPATPAAATPPPGSTPPPRPLTPRQHEERVRAGAQIVYSVRDQYRARIQHFSGKYAATPGEIFAIVNRLPRAHTTGGDAYWDDVEGGLRAHFGF